MEQPITNPTSGSSFYVCCLMFDIDPDPDPELDNYQVKLATLYIKI